jgi:hypothetical protein
LFLSRVLAVSFPFSEVGRPAMLYITGWLLWNRHRRSAQISSCKLFETIKICDFVTFWRLDLLFPSLENATSVKWQISPAIIVLKEMLDIWNYIIILREPNALTNRPCSFQPPLPFHHIWLPLRHCLTPEIVWKCPSLHWILGSFSTRPFSTSRTLFQVDSSIWTHRSPNARYVLESQNVNNWHCFPETYNI